MTYQDDIRNVAELSLPWENLKGCNILITGASGLIGSCLVEVLMERHDKDYQVYAMGRNEKRMNKLFHNYFADGRFHLLTGDVTKPLNCDLPFQYIIHAASGAAPVDFVQHPVEVMMANIEGVRNLIEYGRKHSLKRILYISSGEIYGEGDGRVFTEDYSGSVDCLKSRSCYPSSKRAAETLCASYASEYDVDVVIARPCHTYGPNFTETDNRVYAQFIRNIIRNEDIVMKSTGSQYRSWCYVVDCVKALLFILFMGKSGQAYNIADESSNITIKELAELVSRIGGKKVVVELPDEKEQNGYNPVRKSVYSTVKLAELGWTALVHIDEGMHKTIDAYNSIYKS